jgi:hypothetical protein
MCGMGLIPYINAAGNNYFDLIPADIVSNGILVSTCKQGIDRSKHLNIYNCASSEKNAITMGDYRTYGLEAFEFFKFNKGPFRAQVEFIANEKVF